METPENTKQVAVSVIVPIYNVEKYVGKCLRSVRDQTFSDFEVICIDDGSTDASLETARKAVADDARFTFFSQPNAGLSAARNAGASRASGEYVIFLDSDDYWREDTLAILHEKAQADNLDVLFFSAKSVYESLSMRGVYREEYGSRGSVAGVMSGSAFMVEAKRSGAFQESAVMQILRRDLLVSEGISFYEGILHEDNLFTCMVLAKAKRVAMVDEPLYQRLVRENSIMTRQNVRNAYGRYVCAREIERWVAANGESYDPAFLEALLSHAALCYRFAAEGAEDVGEDELRRFASQLEPRDRWRFWMDVVERMRMMSQTRDEYAQSTSYRLGSFLLTIPRWLKDRFG